MNVVKRMTGLAFRFGGVEHSGWLPPGAAKPLPTPIVDVVIDVEIVPLDIDADPIPPDSSYLLCWQSRDGRYGGDTWYQTLADAEEAAAETFGIQAGDWDAAPVRD